MTTDLRRIGDISYSNANDDQYGNLTFRVSTPLTSGWQAAIDDVMANASNHLIGGITIAANGLSLTVLSPPNPEGIDFVLSRVDYIFELASRFYAAKFHLIDDEAAAQAAVAAAERNDRRLAADYQQRLLTETVAKHNSSPADSIA